ncbi:unnamed protein product [Urochloa decumbens]|uniref:Uncharacterized protein n=1 Tax=Urochloa decumbens TaxID=240449 RepID=A0ABC9G4B6_9POAL
MAPATAAKDATPAPAPAAGGRPQLKLLVDKRSRRVLYAEARKDAVDFLIGLLRVPAGLAARALAAHGERAPGSLGTLYAGARGLDDAFFAAAPLDRDALLSPALPFAVAALLLGGDGALQPPPTPRYFRCAGTAYGASCRGNPTNLTDVSGTPCPACRQPMTVEMRWAPGDAHGKLAAAQAQEAARGEGAAGGYVKEVVTYLVMDDLSIEPMSTISAIMLLKKFSVKDCSALEEMTVELGTKQAVMLLKASLQSSTALTDVFSGGVSIDTIDG